MWVDQDRVESMCTPSNLYVVTFSTVCDAILGKGKLVLGNFVRCYIWDNEPAGSFTHDLIPGNRVY